MTTLHRPASAEAGRAELYDGRWLRLERCVLEAGHREVLRAPAGDECVVVLVRGAATWNGDEVSRPSPFAGRAYAAYLAGDAALDVRATARTELLVATSRFGDVDAVRTAPVVVDPSMVSVQTRGRAEWEREVHDVVVDQVPARHLMVGETFNIAGGWSSFPPHKHDGADGEPELEEAYTFSFDPPEGFGFQAVEQAGDPAAFVVRDGDTVGIPRGYHPVCAAPGYRLSYCWVLSGPVRRLEMVEDPRYTWLHDAG
ncbi:MAG TPA: 5-deoxy-glucuronate isomerase [Acidimicrobiia bacterium]|jgi:5-deoxy-glucuronate isomerase